MDINPSGPIIMQTALAYEGFDIVVVTQGSENLKLAIDFFQQVKQRPAERKGLLRITV